MLTRQMHRLFGPLVALGAVGNLAILISPIFMMQVLDRVVPSGNMTTLLLLLVIALLALASNAVVDYCRDKALGRAAIWVERAMTPSALSAPVDQRQEMLDDIGTLRGFLSGSGATAVIGLPWLPLLLLALWALHPGFLILLVGSASLLFLLTRLGGLLGRPLMQTMQGLESSAKPYFETAALDTGASGQPMLVANLGQYHDQLMLRRDVAASDHVAIDSAIRAAQGFLKMATQIGALALGAFLVVRAGLSPGAMIGASLITSKALSTVDAAISGLPMARRARAAVLRMSEPMAQAAAVPATDLDAFEGGLRVENVIVPAGGGAPPRLDRISFRLEPGECLAIVGDSGSGKTTLLTALAGLQPAPIGAVLLDESDVRSLSPATRARSLGYLPQRAELLPGTVAQNIASFDPQPDDARIQQAARTAGIHGLISALPSGYDTGLDQSQTFLSAGQLQRIALARALYARPRYLFLDEPNALLDATGEHQLFDTLSQLKTMGVTIVMVLHRSGVIGVADKVMHLDHGRVVDFGPRSEVMGRMSTGRRRLQIPMVPAAMPDLTAWIGAQFTRAGDSALAQKATLVATEMFNTALANGGDTPRKATFTFRFLNDQACQIRLAEPRSAEMEGKIRKIQSLVRNPHVTLEDFPPDEMALAMIMQLSDNFEVHSTTTNSAYEALVSQVEAPEMPSREMH